MHPWLKAEIYHCFRPVVFFQASNWVNLVAQGHTFYLQKVAHDFRRPFSRTVFFYAFSSSTIIYLNNLVLSRLFTDYYFFLHWLLPASHLS